MSDLDSLHSKLQGHLDKQEKEWEHFIFSNDGAKKEAEKFQIPFLGSLPIDKELRIQSDEGRPACIDKPDGDIAKIYFEIANSIINSS